MADDNDKVVIAKMASDLSFLRETLTKMENKLEMLNSNMITRAEVETHRSEIQHQLDKRVEAVNQRLDSKVDKEEFSKLEAAFERHIGTGSVNVGQITQNVLTSVITALILGGIVVAVQSGILK